MAHGRGAVYGRSLKIRQICPSIRLVTGSPSTQPSGQVQDGTPTASSTSAFGPAALSLTGRVAVVTGAAKGIGLAAANLLAECGAAVAICDKEEVALASAEAELNEAGRDVLPGLFDVRDLAAVDRFVAQVRDRFGHAEILVNNAGGGFHASFLDVSTRGEAALVAENFTQATALIRAIVPLMPAGGGSIVNLTSVEAHQAAPGFAVYAAMKAALASLTRSLALELAPRRIRVNCVAPDGLPTSGEAGARAEMLAAGNPFEPVLMPPLGHFGVPGDAAAAVLFLASDMSRFITGTTVHVDGGTWAAGGWRLAGQD
jgi:NAD(P)-dependent dehydrogenase (short-subunit alcohol dehydrogenase family)